MQEWLEQMNNLRQTFMKAMDDDFNTANGISVLFELIRSGKPLFD